MDKRYYYEVSFETSGVKDSCEGYLVADSYSDAQGILDNHISVMGYSDDEVKLQMLEHIDADDILQLQIDDVQSDFENLEIAVTDLLIALNITPQDLKQRTTSHGLSNVVCQNLLDALKL